MKPSRELDALVAERVMGWTLGRNADGKTGLLPADWIWTATSSELKSMRFPDIPSYSTDIAAAWEVVERMQGLGYRTELVYGTQADAHATFVLAGLRYRADTGTAPLAICLAALKACGVPVTSP